MLSPRLVRNSGLRNCAGVSLAPLTLLCSGPTWCRMTLYLEQEAREIWLGPGLASLGQCSCRCEGMQRVPAQQGLPLLDTPRVIPTLWKVRLRHLLGCRVAHRWGGSLPSLQSTLTSCQAGMLPTGSAGNRSRTPWYCDPQSLGAGLGALFALIS